MKNEKYIRREELSPILSEITGHIETLYERTNILAAKLSVLRKIKPDRKKGKP